MMKARDSQGFVGLFYFIYGDIYTYMENMEDNSVDSMGEIQPSVMHENLLAVLKRKESLMNLLGYDLKMASYDTFPRGRVCYDFYNKRFIVSTCKEVIDNEDMKQKVIDEFELGGKKVLFRTEYEYEDFEEEYL